jgi:hypothetical protein
MPPVQNCLSQRERERERSIGVENCIMSFAICSLDLKEMEQVVRVDVN